MRLFVSIDPPEPVRMQLAEWVPDIPGIRKMPPDNIHLTLLFLGEKTPENAGQISSCLQDVSFSPFEITVKEIGAFPDKRNPSVIWAGADGKRALLRLQKRIENQVTQFVSERKRPYSPHITLARVSDAALLTGTDIFSGTPGTLTFEVSGFSLKKSVLLPAGAVHKVLKRFP